MKKFLWSLPLLAVLHASAVAQNFDASGNKNLHGDYFVREVLFAGQNPNGTATSAGSVSGIITFDGQGNYTFSGQGITLGKNPSILKLTGTYQLSPSGLLVVSSLVDGTFLCFGGVSAIGPSAFVASATEYNLPSLDQAVDLMIAVPAGSGVSNASLKGSYTAASLDFPGADSGKVRQATFGFTADGAGNLADIAVTGKGLNLGGTTITQTVSGASYSLAGGGSGSMIFGASATGQLVSGNKVLYMSADGNIVFGGSATGYDLFVGFRSISAPASNATANGIYYLAGLETLAQAAAGGASANPLDAFYGSVNANGAGAAIFHNRLESFSQPAYDYTWDSQFTVPGSGVFAPADAPYQFQLALGGQAILATGTGNYYSLVIGLGTPRFSGPGVYLNPVGIVSAANFAPITNPVAPGELVTLYGTGLAASTVVASNLPFPTSLGGVQVTVNGTPAPLVYVSAGQITALVPGAVGPGNGVFNATFRVINNGVASNPVTVYTSDTAPGVISLGSNAIGPAAAQHSNYSVIGTSNPAKPGETVIVYLTGLGSTAPSVGDGEPAPSSPLATVDALVSVDFSGAAGTIAFAGLTPTAAGLYQINVAIPAGARPGDVYVNVSTADGYTSEATLNIAGTAGAGGGGLAGRILPRGGKPPHRREPPSVRAIP